jgi:endonuclease YncB( thermonuclease family)
MLLLPVFLLLCPFSPERDRGAVTCAAASELLSGVVTTVYDGDTVDVRERSARVVRIRLYGIDAPETGKRGVRGQPYAGEAKRALMEKVLGRQVVLEIMDWDHYGRAVAVIRLGGRDVNRDMVSQGWAWAYRHYLQGPYASAYIGAEELSRMHRLGIWRQDNPQPPWEFRHLQGDGR